MNYIIGLILIVLGVSMIFFGKPQNGVPRAFLRSYPVGIAYTMTAMILLVGGAAWMMFGSG
jgi:drug/metabolite transporter (DMT)-like permease